MKKKEYTKEQISEALKFWRKQLKAINEAESFTVDDAYINNALELLEPLKADHKEDYDRAVKYLNYQKGRTLAVSPDAFASRRIANAQSASTSIADAPSTSREDLMKSVADKNKAEHDKMEQDKFMKHKIKSIWVKDLNIDRMHEDQSKAQLELTMVDGSVHDMDFPIGTTGAGERGNFINNDAFYKEIKSHMRKPRGLNEITDVDVRLMMIRIAFNDWQIKWYYGPSKKADNIWGFAHNDEEISQMSSVKAARKSWADKIDMDDFHNWTSFKSGNATIYRRNG